MTDEEVVRQRRDRRRVRRQHRQPGQPGKQGTAPAAVPGAQGHPAPDSGTGSQPTRAGHTTDDRQSETAGPPQYESRATPRGLPPVLLAALRRSVRRDHPPGAQQQAAEALRRSREQRRNP